MPSEEAFFQTADSSSIWQRYCGFLDLTLKEFMQIQEHLFNEQIGLIADSKLGKTMLHGARPATVAEFRRVMPLTRYADYSPYLNGHQEYSPGDIQPAWVHTSAPGGAFKRVPWAQHFQKVQGRNIMAAMILSSAPAKDEIVVAPGLKLLLIVPGQPFASASLASSLAADFTARILPPLDANDKMPFRHKIDAGLRAALTTDLDFVISMTSSLLRIGDRANDVFRHGRLPIGLRRLHPRVLGRVLWRRIGNRRQLAPKDIWSVKGIIGWGADTDAFKASIEEQWGKPLYQMYASSEAGVIALQESTRGPLAFLPDSVFLEFLPEGQQDAGKTVLIDQVEDGKLYEPIITSFYGMPFLRYRQGDLVRIWKNASNLVSRMTFHSRADDVIDLFGIARLNTDTVSRALELAGVEHGEWCLRKEYGENRVTLRLYIELGDETQAQVMERHFHKGLKAADQHYREAVYTMACNPVRVTALPAGAFKGLAQANGEGFRQIRMNPPEHIIRQLLG